MRFNVLGPLVVEADDGSEATPRGAQPRKLLTALVAAAPDPVPVDALNELLWPTDSPTANALQSQISKLRRALAGVDIIAERRGYALLPGPADSVDVVEFESLVRAGRPGFGRHRCRGDGRRRHAADRLVRTGREEDRPTAHRSPRPCRARQRARDDLRPLGRPRRPSPVAVRHRQLRRSGGARRPRAGDAHRHGR